MTDRRNSTVADVSGFSMGFRFSKKRAGSNSIDSEGRVKRLRVSTATSVFVFSFTSTVLAQGNSGNLLQQAVKGTLKPATIYVTSGSTILTNRSSHKSWQALESLSLPAVTNYRYFLEPRPYS